MIWWRNELLHFNWILYFWCKYARSRPEDKYRFNNWDTEEFFFSPSSEFIIGILHSNHLNGSLIGKYISLSGWRQQRIVCMRHWDKTNILDATVVMLRNELHTLSERTRVARTQRIQWAPALFALLASSSLHHLSMEYVRYASNTVNTVQSNERLIAFV